MMSNSTLPLGFLHSNTQLAACGQLFSYLDVALPVELLLVCPTGGSDKVDQFHNLTTHLHLIVRMNDKLRQAVSIDEALAIVVNIHLETVLGITDMKINDYE